ncbi:TerB family tellurite resistance protein [Paracoccus sp. Z118]|uniref:TerB family tellurite resistance protein n=1 Tax=Paracoccus sp. Z118 TaxID=2851017 RepID=UPI001C2C75D0|nr:TerB family tellurite resistance protein [Paracoccus sp. Z118]MBV0892045.1 TerB family tellurite resistance protein [Paracoccus sp. Z118]
MSSLTNEEQISSFDSVRRVVSNDIRFKARLGIGEDAYKSLKLGNSAADLWDIGGAAGTGAAIAQSQMVAGSFFVKTGLLSSLGIVSAATPVGWVVAAAVATGGAYYGVSRLFRSYAGSRVDVVPNFLNTPLDVLGASLLDLIGSLAIKVAIIDGKIEISERRVIEDYFIQNWGYDSEYVVHALDVLEQNADKAKLTDMTSALADFVRANPDCKFKAIQSEVKLMLHEIASADGKLDEREEMAIERIVSSLEQQNSLAASLSRTTAGAVSSASSAAGWLGGKLKGSRSSS